MVYGGMAVIHPRRRFFRGEGAPFYLAGRGIIQPSSLYGQQLQIGINVGRPRGARLLMCEAVLRRLANDLSIEIPLANLGRLTQRYHLRQWHNLQRSFEGRRFAEVTRGLLESVGQLEDLIWINGMLRSGLAKARDRC